MTIYVESSTLKKRGHAYFQSIVVFDLSGETEYDGLKCWQSDDYDYYLSDKETEDGSFINLNKIKELKAYENLKKLIGKEFNADDIICCFECVEENVNVDKLNNSSWEWVVSIDEEDSASFYIELYPNDTIAEIDVYDLYNA